MLSLVDFLDCINRGYIPKSLEIANDPGIVALDFFAAFIQKYDKKSRGICNVRPFMSPAFMI
jgi:hypothetical protein